MFLTTGLLLVCWTIVDGGLGVIGGLSSLLAAGHFFCCLLRLAGFSLPLGKGVSFSHYESSDGVAVAHPQSHYLVYGVVKFSIVLLVTCVLAVPFGFAATWLSKQAIRCCGPSRTAKRVEKG